MAGDLKLLPVVALLAIIGVDKTLAKSETTAGDNSKDWDLILGVFLALFAIIAVDIPLSMLPVRIGLKLTFLGLSSIVGLIPLFFCIFLPLLPLEKRNQGNEIPDIGNNDGFHRRGSSVGRSGGESDCIEHST